MDKYRRQAAETHADAALAPMSGDALAIHSTTRVRPINYRKATGLRVWVLLNFGKPRLVIQQIVR